MSKFQLKSNTAGGAKTVRSNAFKATVLVNNMTGGMTAKQALAAAVEQYEADSCESFEKHPSTFIHSYKTTIGKILGNPEHKDYDSVVAICQDGGLVDEVEETEVEDVMEARSDVPDDIEALEADRAQM